MREYKAKTSKIRGSADESYLGKSVDEMIWEFMSDNQIDGLTMAIVQAPYIPRAVGYGFSDVKQKRLSSVNTMWPIGHISQGFTAVAIMQLHESGKLCINDSMSKYLSNIPKRWRDITIIELLRHSSGIADYSLSSKFNSAKEYSFESLISLVEKDELKFKPGTGVYESATNFLLLAEIMERVTDNGYEEFIKENQIDYLNLKHTGFINDMNSFYHEDVSLTKDIHELFKIDKNYIDPTEFAASYNSNDKQIPRVESSALKGYTDIWASAQDVSFWDIALAGSVLIHEPDNRALIYQPWKLFNGKSIPEVAGWQFYHHKGLMDIKGTVKGYSSYLSRFTDSSELVCVTLMANKEGIDFTNLARCIAAAFCGTIATGYNDNDLYLLESQFSVDEMVDRLERELKRKNIPVFAKINHQKNAEEVKLNLRPTTVVIFGSPQVGTYLMQEDQSISIELPLRISMWEDESGSTWIGFQRVSKMISEYNITNLEVPKKIEALLQEIAHKVSDIYYFDKTI